ncbi:MAG: hypothetical protein QG646_2189 [Euryarchaeota archaeon]|nr:hypothetical protein [Euryarchaeota archaeon]
MKVLKAVKYNSIIGYHNLPIIRLQISFFIAWLFYVKSLIIHAINTIFQVIGSHLPLLSFLITRRNREIDNGQI